MYSGVTFHMLVVFGAVVGTISTVQLKHIDIIPCIWEALSTGDEQKITIEEVNELAEGMC